MKKINSFACVFTTIFVIIMFLTSCNSPTAYTSDVLSAIPTATATPTIAPTATPTQAPYHVGGPDIIGIYVNNKLLGDEYRTTWIKGKDIGVFYIYSSTDESLEPMPYMDQFKLHWNKYPNSSEYRIAYKLVFTLKSSEVVTLYIREPNDCPKDPQAYFYQFIEVYVYDNLNRIPGKTFYHLEESSTFDNTIMTSIKLTAGTEFDEVESAVLSAFIYLDESEFDTVTGEYIGRTLATVSVINDIP